ncbi:MAG TPA: hypothetical protein DIW81_24230, partial [Planctomycetaceae bacterium]|nr:hypothetical protein [Planctomycetaceae bacterium]
AIGRYISKKNQTMTISSRDDQLYCSIDWGNKAPLTNGWIRADVSGKTILTGYKWQHPVDIEFEDGTIRSISLVGETFDRARDSAPVGAAE